jgi:hypothetical protein
MKTNLFKPLFQMLLFFLTVAFVLPVSAVSPGVLPYRVLVVIGDQWEDPASCLVTAPSPAPEYSGYYNRPVLPGQEDFHHLMILLKSWGIPFDVVRLDQQLLDRYMFLDMYDRPKYGTVLWDVRQSDRLLRQDYSLLKEMVEDYGIGLVALTDRISPGTIQSLLGLEYSGSWESDAVMKVVAPHFLTRGLPAVIRMDRDPGAEYNFGVHLRREQVKTLRGTVTLVEQGTFPQVTARTLPSGAHAVWIGNDPGYLFFYPGIRTLLRRAITWTIGYSFCKTWENEAIMIMDDPGGAQNVYLEHWHYPELTEEVIGKYLIGPLKKHHAVLNINFVPAFVSDAKGRMEPSWVQRFTDGFGVEQDYISAKRGFDKGVKEGVFEVMCHGLTHMQPDLVSDPGWYGGSLEQEKAEVGWYREFGDTRRHKEIPAAEQLWRMKTGKAWLTEQFGVEPLEFCAGGNGASVSYPYNTFRLAAQAGFGWAGWEAGYLGPDMVILGWDFTGTADSPLITGAPPNGHDFGITQDPGAFAKIFEEYPSVRFMSINEFIGYLHTSLTGRWLKTSRTLKIIVDYDPHYCRYFRDHPSGWTFQTADWFEERMGKISGVTVDTKPFLLTVPGRLPFPGGPGSIQWK